MIDLNANATIAGERYYARIDQYDRNGYVSVSSSQGDSMIRVASADVHSLAVQVSKGIATDLPVGELAILGIAGLVFTAERRGTAPMSDFI